MALPEKHENLEVGLNIAAEIVSTCTGIPVLGTVTNAVIKKLLEEFSSPTLKLKDVLNKKTGKSLGIPDSKFDSVFEQTRIALKSINSENYNSSIFRKDVFTNNCFNPVTIADEIILSLELGENEKSDVLKAVRFVLAVYLLRWKDEPEFSLETRQQVQSLTITTNNLRKEIEILKKNQSNKKNQKEKLERTDTEPIPAELTIIPKAITSLIGREQAINDIKSRLGTERILCINAEGGLGKTAIAKCIINNVRNSIGKRRYKYKFVAWLTSSGNLKEDLSQIVISNTKTLDQEAKFRKACRFLQTNPTFLVVDNMDELPTPDEINILNTIAGKTTILITTRAITDGLPSYKLPPLDRDTAVALFYNQFFRNHDITNITHEELYEELATGQIEEVYKIVDASGRNTLIIELLAKTACAEDWKVSELWERFSLGIFGFESKTEVQTDHSGKYHEFKLSIDEQMLRLYAMLNLSDIQKEIMSFISLFPAEHDIFSEVFKWAGFLDHDANAMKDLVNSGWIIHEDNYYSVHTIVRDSINLQNKKRGYVISLVKYEGLIKKLSDIDYYIPRTTDYNLAQKLSFVPQTVGKILSENATSNTTIATFFINLADLYDNQGNYDEAIKFNKLGLKIYKKKPGIIHPATAATYNSLANIYKNKGDCKKALKFYKIALLIRKITLGKYDPATAATYNNIASIYQNQGKYVKAAIYFNKAFNSDEMLFCKNDSDTATTYNNLAISYHKQGELDKALTFYKMALDIDEKTLGREHPDTATTYHNLACLYKDKGDYVEALKYFNWALEIREKKQGKNHPDIAKTYNSLADFYQVQKDFDKALKYYNMALEIQEKKPGGGDLDTAKTYNNFGGLFHEYGYYDEALKYYNMALEITEKTLGRNSTYTAISYSNIALLLKDLGYYDDALDFYYIALEIYLKVLGIHQKTAIAYDKLADLHLKIGNYDESRRCKAWADKIRKILRNKEMRKL